jgi:hypothetical protein
VVYYNNKHEAYYSMPFLKIIFKQKHFKFWFNLLLDKFNIIIILSLITCMISGEINV